MNFKILEYDTYLKPFEADIKLRYNLYKNKKQTLLSSGQTLCDFANAHKHFGFHKVRGGWYYREWAPGADAVYIMGDMNGWNKTSLPLKKLDYGVWEIFLSGDSALYGGCKVKTVVEKNGELLERIPLYARRVVQDPVTYAWTAEILDDKPYKWKKRSFTPPENLFIYECHIGMAQEKAEVGSFREFTDDILPKIKELGYTAIQIMAIMEHPYYGSFGYQVSSFFAVSSRFGMPEDLKRLIDTAHGMGIAVLLDVIHSHAVKNTAEGINCFDGTDFQFFHLGERGEHPAWDTKLFNYDKNEVIHFLLSNLKFWLEEYHFDGFRFDGVTSMIYRDHGLGSAFTDYGKYFSLNTDVEAITYLQLANELIREVNPKAITIAEDMSAMPGMCLPIEEGGVGFDYRLSMGVPDMWIKLLKNCRDEDWNMFYLWHELTSRRPKEKYIGYAESHDQALVGDKTIMFWLCDADMYTNMSKSTPSLVIDRGIALHKMIRLITISLAGEGYLNFMGNEFGHPEWIDFPREGNGWSYHYCRRQWSLADDKNLKYEWLKEFDKAMLCLAKDNKFFSSSPQSLFIDDEKKVIVFKRANMIFAFNFHPTNCYDGYFIKTGANGNYQVCFSTDEESFGGYNRIPKATYCSEKNANGELGIKMYLPSRTAVCIKRKNR